MVFIVSDGVHDNLDPESLGLTPKDLGVNAERLRLSTIDIVKPQMEDDQSMAETEGTSEETPRLPKTVATPEKGQENVLSELQRQTNSLNAASVLFNDITISTPGVPTFASPDNQKPSGDSSDSSKPAVTIPADNSVKTAQSPNITRAPNAKRTPSFL